MQSKKHQKHKGKDKEREVIATLNNTFITPIDREDIQSLTIAIRKINKKICEVLNCKETDISKLDPKEITRQIESLTALMNVAVKSLDFEKAIGIFTSGRMVAWT